MSEAHKARRHGRHDQDMGKRPLRSLLLIALLLLGGTDALARGIRPKDAEAVQTAIARLGETMRRADDLEKQGRLVEAEPLWRSALDQRKTLLGDRNPLVASAMDRLARNLEMQGRYKQAEPLRRATLHLLAGNPASAKDMPAAHSALGYNLTLQGNLHEGAAQSYKALALLRAAGKAEDTEAARALSVVGLTLDKQELFSKAEPFYRRALDIRRRMLDADDLDTATSYNNLAAALSGQGRFAEAQPLFEAALAIREANGTVPGLVAENALNIALNLDKQRQYGKAHLIYGIAIDIWTRMYGAEHVMTANGYNGLGMNYFRQDRFADAAVQFDRARRLREAALGRNNPETAESYGNLGLAERALGHEKEGRRLLAVALAIDERTVGVDHPQTKALRAALAAPAPSPREQVVTPREQVVTVIYSEPAAKDKAK